MWVGGVRKVSLRPIEVKGPPKKKNVSRLKSDNRDFLSGELELLKFKVSCVVTFLHLPRKNEAEVDTASFLSF